MEEQQDAELPSKPHRLNKLNLVRQAHMQTVSPLLLYRVPEFQVFGGFEP